MSRLDSTIIILMVQITVPLVAALVLSLRRSHWASSRSLAWGATAVLLLTPCAFLPMPSWSFRTQTPVVADAGNEAISTLEERPEPSPTANRTASAPGIDLLRLVRSVQIEPTQFQSQRSATNDWLAYAIIGLAGLGLLRFGVGWVSLIWMRRQSHLLVDGEVQTMLAELSTELGCRKQIELRESSRIGSAATTGWFRPAILLSADWRTWTPVECRAVLAHEVAHVLRRDFLSRFLARLAGAIHGYHPLVQWLMRRLELRQELAADALAAPCVGGSSAYLRCLASLALKADAAVVGVAPTFHSRPRTLLRRITMLQVKDDKRSWSTGWWSAVVVGALSVLALGLHGQSPKAVAAPETPAPMPAAQQPGIDIALLDLEDNPDNVGLCSLRPGKVFGLPGMDKIVPQFFAATNVLPANWISNLSNIEQVVGRMCIKVEPNKPAPNHNLMMSLDVIRFKHDIDWANEIKKGFDKAKTCKCGDETYFEIVPPAWLLGVAGAKMKVNLYPTDGRTLFIMDSEKDIKQFIDRKKAKTQKPKWHDQWRQVEQDTFAMVLTDVQKSFKDKLAVKDLDPKMSADEKAAIGAVEKIFSKTESVLLSLDLGKSLSWKLRLNATTAEDLPMISQQCESIWKVLKVKLGVDSPSKGGADAAEVKQEQILMAIFKKPSLRLAGQSVIIDSESTEAMEAINKAIQAIVPMK